MDKQSIGKINIVDINGRVIKTIESHEKSRTINLSNYFSGIYILHSVGINKAIKLIRE